MTTCLAQIRLALGVAAMITLSGGASARALAGAQDALPFPFLVASTQALDTATCRTQALAAEQAGDAAGALMAWERAIDRCPATEEQRAEARARIRPLRAVVPRNTDPAKARPWRVLVVIFRELRITWSDKDQTRREVHKVVNPANEQAIRGSVAAFGRHVFHLSSGMLRVDADTRVVDAPLTNLHRTAQGAFTPAPHVLRWAIEPLAKGKAYDTIIAYVKYNGDEGPAVPAPFTAATFGSIRDFGGGGFIMVPWHTNYPYPGETDGEMELHEWLHQMDDIFAKVLRYPPELVPTSDAGRLEGEDRPGGDPEYRRKRSETTWMGFYRHIMEDHITRQMWFEARSGAR